MAGYTVGMAGYTVGMAGYTVGIANYMNCDCTIRVSRSLQHRCSINTLLQRSKSHMETMNLEDSINSYIVVVHNNFCIHANTKYQVYSMLIITMALHT